VLLKLIKILGEKDSKTFEILLKSRAKHLREMTQRKVIECQRIDPLLKDIQGFLSYKIEKSSDSEVKPNQKVFQKAIEASAIVLNCKKEAKIQDFYSEVSESAMISLL
jgi:hypothetical protein